MDDSRSSFPKKIALAQSSQYNFILVVGAEEAKANTVNVRTRSNEVLGAKPLQEVLEMLQKLKADFK